MYQTGAAEPRLTISGGEASPHRAPSSRADKVPWRNRVKAGPMERSRAVEAQRRQMLGGSIAHVPFPAKARKVARSRDHEAIAMLFGDDARRRDARVQRTAADDGARAIAPARQAVAVDQYLVRVAPPCLDRARHREEGERKSGV